MAKWVLIILLLLSTSSFAQNSKDLLTSVNRCLTGPSNNQAGAKATCIQEAIVAQSPIKAPQLQTTTDQITQLYTNTYLAAVRKQQEYTSGGGTNATRPAANITPTVAPIQPSTITRPQPAPAPAPTATTPAPATTGIKYY